MWFVLLSQKKQISQTFRNFHKEVAVQMSLFLGTQKWGSLKSTISAYIQK